MDVTEDAEVRLLMDAVKLVLREHDRIGDLRPRPDTRYLDEACAAMKTALDNLECPPPPKPDDNKEPQ